MRGKYEVQARERRGPARAALKSGRLQREQNLPTSIPKAELRNPKEGRSPKSEQRVIGWAAVLRERQWIGP